MLTPHVTIHGTDQQSPNKVYVMPQITAVKLYLLEYYFEPAPNNPSETRIHFFKATPPPVAGMCQVHLPCLVGIPGDLGLSKT